MHVAHAVDISVSGKGEQKMRYVFRSISVVIFVTTLLNGCVALTGKTAGRNVDDATITASVKTKLAAERAATLTSVDVDTNQGVVYLNGVVESVAMKQHAAEVAQQVAGVTKVVNNLQIQASR
jgi:hyperosmotically inducible periplasmic protein